LQNVHPSALYHGPLHLKLNYLREKQFGGAQGTIFLTSCDGCIVKLFKKGPHAEQQFETEMSVLRMFNHPNIVSYFGTVHFSKQLAEYGLYQHLGLGILMERCHDETFDNISFFKKSGAFRAQKYKQVARELLTGVSVIHKAGIIHHDLKPENILVERGTFVTKIADFGLAMKADEAIDGRFGGTPGFIAPELFEGAKPCKLCDIWSAMICLIGAISARPEPILYMASRRRILETGAYELVRTSIWSRVRAAAAVQRGPADKEDFLGFALAGVAPIEDRWNAEEILTLPYLQDTNTN